MAYLLLLCLTTTPDYHCTLPLTRISSSRIKMSLSSKAQQRCASIPFFLGSFVPFFHAAQSSRLTRSVRTQSRCCLAYCCFA